jgi:hypothetical protein
MRDLCRWRYACQQANGLKSDLTSAYKSFSSRDSALVRDATALIVYCNSRSRTVGNVGTCLTYSCVVGIWFPYPRGIQ